MTVAALTSWGEPQDCHNCRKTPQNTKLESSVLSSRGSWRDEGTETGHWTVLAVRQGPRVHRVTLGVGEGKVRDMGRGRADPERQFPNCHIPAAPKQS